MRFIRWIVSLTKHKIYPGVSRYILIFILALVMGIFWGFLREDINLSSASIAFGTLILAFITAWSVQVSIESGKRDRRERKLITIISWANDIAKCETAVPIAPLPVPEVLKTASELGYESVQTIFKYHHTNILTNLAMRYQGLDSMGEQIALIAKGLDKQLGSKLECLAQKTADKLTKHTDLGMKLIARGITDEEYKTHWESLLEMAKALAKEATEIIGAQEQNKRVKNNESTQIRKAKRS